MGIGVPRSGITIGSPVYEWIAAAHWDNMSYKKFKRQPVEYREKIIAAYRTADQIRAVIDKSQRKKGS